MLGFNYEFKHFDKNGELLYKEDFVPNNIANEGWKNIFNSYFRDEENPTKFQIGLLKEEPSVDSSIGDLVELEEEHGYERKDLSRSATNFSSTSLSNGDVIIEADSVEFENTSEEDNWDTVKYGFMCAVMQDESVKFLSWRGLSADRVLTPGDKLIVSVTPKGIIESE